MSVSRSWRGAEAHLHHGVEADGRG
jgi:hypothetical protein